jgi:hypothetical protein
VNYFSNGSTSYPKEQLDVFFDGRVLKLENFRVTRGYGFSGFKKFKTRKQDKGHKAEINAFIERVKDRAGPLIPFEQLWNVTSASFAAMRAAREGKVVSLLAAARQPKVGGGGGEVGERKEQL